MKTICALSFLLCALPSSSSAIVAESQVCVSGELPQGSFPKDFTRPKISLDCWRSERGGDGNGIWFKAYFDVSPDGRTENIEIDAVDPVCARGGVKQMIAEWIFECSELGQKRMRIITTISSPAYSD